MGKPKIEMLGRRFGRLVVTGESPRERYPNGRMVSLKYTALCDCGGEIVTFGESLRRGETQSCGCLQSERASEAVTTHGECLTRERTAEYRAWCNIITRCLNPKASNYDYYGGRGITVCDRWRNSFESFLADMGRKPSSAHSIDRINNDGDYEPQNCRWATKVEQRANRRR